MLWGKYINTWADKSKTFCLHLFQNIESKKLKFVNIPLSFVPQEIKKTTVSFNCRMQYSKFSDVKKYKCTLE